MRTGGMDTAWIIVQFEFLDTTGEAHWPRCSGEETVQDVKALSDMEREYILQVLQKTGWRIEGRAGAAVILGLNPGTLRGRMRKYGISR